MKIAITIPTGKIGAPLVDLLAEHHGGDLVLLARHREKLIDAAARGATIVPGDLYDEQYVCRATRGCDALFWAAPVDYHTQDLCGDFRRLAENACAAVDDNAIARVVHLSSIGAHRAESLGPVLAARESEILLDQCDASIAHMRIGYLMENFLWHVDEINLDGAIRLPIAGSVRVPMIADADVALEAARLLTDDTWSGRNTAEIVGPSDVSFDEAAGDIGDAIGREVRHVRVSLGRAREMLLGMDVSRHCAEMLLDLLGGIDTGLYRMEHTRREAIVTPTSFAQFARSVMVAALHAREPAVPT